MSEGGYLVPEEFAIDIKAHSLMLSKNIGLRVPMDSLPSWEAYTEAKQRLYSWWWKLARRVTPLRHERFVQRVRSLDLMVKQELINAVLELDES
jgi:hypothetical protein